MTFTSIIHDHITLMRFSSYAVQHSIFGCNSQTSLHAPPIAHYYSSFRLWLTSIFISPLTELYSTYLNSFASSSSSPCIIIPGAPSPYLIGATHLHLSSPHILIFISQRRSQTQTLSRLVSCHLQTTFSFLPMDISLQYSSPWDLFPYLSCSVLSLLPPYRD